MKRDLYWVVAAGGILGVVALALVELGNPPNMGFCLACFDRDIAGAIGLFNWNLPLGYVRPEIVGIVLGSMLTAMAFREFGPKGGSSPALRFMLGMFMMIGALVFLGCPTRLVLRLGGGDLNAVVALAGFVLGIAGGVYYLRRGYNLGRTQGTGWLDGLVLPAFLAVLLLLLVFQMQFVEGGPILTQAKAFVGGPNSPIPLAAGISISLAGGLLVGFLGQRSRLCFAGGFRDIFVMRSGHLFWGIFVLLVVMVIGNLALGNFHLGFDGQPIAHADHLWNFFGMALVGLCATLLGGCPFRQLILAGNGNTDSAMTVIGMLAGAAFAHNFMLASKVGEGATVYGKAAVLGGLALVLLVAILNRRK